jgi:hypothetical protein
MAAEAPAVVPACCAAMTAWATAGSGALGLPGMAMLAIP